MKNKLGIFGMAVSFVGSILGAGYVSGQELWLYFGSYGISGYFGLLISILILSLATAAVMWISSETGESSIDTILFSSKGPSFLREGVGILFVFFYFCITTIMLAGIASLCSQLLGLPFAAGSLISTVLFMFVTYYGLQGMTAVFSFSIPILVAAAVLISLIRIGSCQPDSIVFENTASNPLLGNFLLSAVNYASCNIFASIGILAPLAAFLKQKRSAPVGILLGGTLLLLIAYAILLALATSPASVTADLPMLELSSRMGSIYSAVYGTLLFLGMFGSGVSTTVAVDTWMSARFPVLTGHRILFLSVTGLAAFLLSLCGFTDLVGIVYPLMGYVGLASTVLVFLRVFRLKKH